MVVVILAFLLEDHRLEPRLGVFVDHGHDGAAVANAEVPSELHDGAEYGAAPDLHASH